jgi:hypothetical protein
MTALEKSRFGVSAPMAAESIEIHTTARNVFMGNLSGGFV